MIAFSSMPEYATVVLTINLDIWLRIPQVYNAISNHCIADDEAYHAIVILLIMGTLMP